MKVCPQCNKDFKPSSNHKLCPICRYNNKKDFCKCGSLKAGQSEMCSSCWATKQSLSLNGNWKGGKTKHKSGYVLIRKPEHPRAKSNSGYVFEHILVIENSIGRYLLPGENVHHLNGIRDDNRIENLELWTKPQPSGIRAEDALQWAKEIIKLYGGDAG